MKMSPALMVKQWLCRLVHRGKVFDVFNTAEEGTVLFAPIEGWTMTSGGPVGGWMSTVQIPVRRKDLKRDVGKLIPRPGRR